MLAIRFMLLLISSNEQYMRSLHSIPSDRTDFTWTTRIRLTIIRYSVDDLVSFFFFFFQAEDGIRDDLVTGVQTCALPICLAAARRIRPGRRPGSLGSSAQLARRPAGLVQPRRSGAGRARRRAAGHRHGARLRSGLAHTRVPLDVPGSGGGGAHRAGGGFRALRQRRVAGVAALHRRGAGGYGRSAPPRAGAGGARAPARRVV